MEQDNRLTQEQEQYLKDSLARGVAFEAFIRSDAYAYLKGYYESAIKLFSTTAIKQGFKDMEEFNLERGKVLGMSNLFDGINSSIQTLEEARKKDAGLTE